MMNEHSFLSFGERDALKNEILASLRCALPGTVLSFDAEKQTADIRPAVRPGPVPFPVLSGVPVFMPVPFDVRPGDACLVVFADLDADAWLTSGSEEKPLSSRKHSLSDGFAFIGFKCPESS